MPTASAIRLQIESALAQKIPSALTPASKMIRPVAATGIASLDDILSGGLSRSRETEIATKTILLECAGAFSPRVEERSQNTAFLCGINISGTQALFGPTENAYADRAARPAKHGQNSSGSSCCPASVPSSGTSDERGEEQCKSDD